MQRLGNLLIDWITASPREVALFDVGNQLYLLTVSFFNAVIYAFVPVFTRLHLAGRDPTMQTALLLGGRSGSLYGGGITFTWQKSTEIRRFIGDELGMHILHLVGIGSCSGSEVDPLGSITRPSRLDADERAELMRLELALAPDHPDAGRMLFAIAQKPEVA